MINIQKYLLETIAGAFLLLFLFWAIGYFANALYGTKFDLQSCWNGVAALGGGGIITLVKYAVDSWKNSPQGIYPDVKTTVTKGETK